MARSTKETWAKRVQRWMDSAVTAKEFASATQEIRRTLAVPPLAP